MNHPKITYFRGKLYAANSLLEIFERRFEIDEDQNPRLVYYWILDIERMAREIGMRFYSRRGRMTLIGLLYRYRLWLRENVYSKSLLSLNDLLDSNGFLKPQKINDETIDIEELIGQIAQETRVLKSLIQDYYLKEAQLIEEFKQDARERIKRLTSTWTSSNTA